MISCIQESNDRFFFFCGQFLERPNYLEVETCTSAGIFLQFREFFIKHSTYSINFCSAVLWDKSLLYETGHAHQRCHNETSKGDRECVQKVMVRQVSAGCQAGPFDCPKSGSSPLAEDEILIVR